MSTEETEWHNNKISLILKKTEKKKKWKVCNIMTNIKPNVPRIMLNISELKPLITSKDSPAGLKEQGEAVSSLKEMNFKYKDTSTLKVKHWKKKYRQLFGFINYKLEVKLRSINRQKEGNCIIKKRVSKEN